MKKILLFAFVALLSFISCKDDEPSYEPKLIIKLKLDSTQQRLNNIGQPAVMPANHAAQNPQYEGAKCEPPEPQPYGALVAYLWDPSGVLWHIAEMSAELTE